MLLALGWTDAGRPRRRCRDGRDRRALARVLMPSLRWHLGPGRRRRSPRYTRRLRPDESVPTASGGGGPSKRPWRGRHCFTRVKQWRSVGRAGRRAIGRERPALRVPRALGRDVAFPPLRGRGVSAVAGNRFGATTLPAYALSAQSGPATAAVREARPDTKSRSGSAGDPVRGKTVVYTTVGRAT